MAAAFAAAMFSTAAAFVTAASHSAITGISTDRPIIITRPTTAAGSSGPITARAASVISAIGTIADIGEFRSGG
jgi:hypothetical protein